MTGAVIEGDRIPDVHVRNGLHPCKNITHLSRGEGVAFLSGEQEPPDLFDPIGRLIPNEADDVSILHCGDLGDTLTDELVDEIGDVDILLIPVGGHYTIDASEVVDTIHKIEPGIVIPMHYNHKDLDQKTFKDLTGLEEFVKAYGSAPAETLDVLALKKEDVPEETKLIVMNIT